MGTLILTDDTYAKIKEYVSLIDAEIGMFGYVKMDNTDFVVDDVFLVEQEVSGSSVDFADAGLEYAIERAIKDGRIEDLKFCCHSHVDMDAFWSGTDDKMIAGMNNGMTPYLVSLVINKRYETKQRVDFYNPSGPIGDYAKQITFDLDLEVEIAPDPEVAKEIEELVTHRRYQYQSQTNGRKNQADWWKNTPPKQLPLPPTTPATIADDDPSDADIIAMGFKDRADFEAFAFDLDYEDFLR